MKYDKTFFFYVLKGNYSLKLCCKLKRAKSFSFCRWNGLSIVIYLRKDDLYIGI